MATFFRKMLLTVIFSLSAVIAGYIIFEIFGMNKDNADTQYLNETDTESIDSGKVLFNAKCGFCHDAYSTEAMAGPGLKGILKKERLPFSNRPSTRENIIRQLKKPVDRMPAFEYLSKEETSDIIAFLSTL